VIHSDPSDNNTSALLQSTRARLDSASYTGPCRIRLGLYPPRLPPTPILPCLPGPLRNPSSGLGRTGAPCESHIMHPSELLAAQMVLHADSPSLPPLGLDPPLGSPMPSQLFGCCLVRCPTDRNQNQRSPHFPCFCAKRQGATV
jgi:hypothetical protein